MKNESSPPEVRFTGEIHPAANLFPMLTNEELDDLARDIEAHGLGHPLILDDEGRLIDGRNRLEACRRAGIEPTFTRLNGADATRKILSENAMRRNLTKGQLAIIVILALPEKSKTQQEAGAEYGISQQMMSKAQQIVRHALREAHQVKDGLKTFNEALELAEERRDAEETDEERVERIRRADPDLAGLVAEGTLTVEAAWFELQQRRQNEKEEIRQELEYQRTLTAELARILLHLDPGDQDPVQLAANWLQADARLLPEAPELGPERALRAARTLTLYAEMRSENDGQKETRTRATGGLDRLPRPAHRSGKG